MTIRSLCLLLLIIPVTRAQTPSDFPDLRNAEIPGAPKLGKPMLIRGETGPVLTELHGLASPATFDWNGDGKKDLLIGEFETGKCGVRIYLNVGTNDAPRFTDEFEYAKTRRGKRIEIDSW